MNFTIVDNQNGLFIVQSVDSLGKALPLPSDTACATSNAAVLAVGTATVPGQFPVTGLGAGSDGTVNLTVSSAIAGISTVFTFVVTTSDVAVGFTATLINVVTNVVPAAA